jgi:SpoVK/Ycf46/Vps4 family AAA+-type ATPase
MSNKENYVWTSDNGIDFFPSRSIVSNIPSGFYFSKYSSDYGTYMSKIESKLDSNLEIAEKYYKLIEQDFEKFWSLTDTMRDSGLEMRRAIMLYGQPSNGKKYIAKRIGEKFVNEHDGIVLYAEDPDDAKKAIKHIRLVEGSSRKIMVVIEEIGIGLEKYGAQSIISFLKGINNEDGVYIIATTNYEDRIADFVSDKPRMFNRKFLIEYPDKKERKKYISDLLKLIKKEQSERNLNKFTKDTEGLSIGHIRNLIESHFLFDYDYAETLEELKTMKENIESSFYDTSDDTDERQGIGFN